MKRTLFLLSLMLCQASFGQGSRFAVRFHGTGRNQADRIRIPLAAAPALNVGGDFTFEFWMRAGYADNAGTVATGLDGDGWITGNVILDRDVYGAGDYGDFGLAVGRRTGKLVLAFGANNGSAGQTIVGTNNVGDNVWRHVAITREQASGIMRIYVDGVLDAAGTGPGGNLAYRVGRPTGWPNSDPYLVIGAEKHDAGAEYPSLNGYVDELRVWSRALDAVELSAIASRILPSGTTTGLVAYFRLEEGAGTTLRDAVSGYAGTLSAGVAGNGEWTSWSAGAHAAPILPFIPVIAMQSRAGGTWELSWFVPSNHRFTVETASDLAGAAAWSPHAEWVDLVATDTNVTVTVETGDAPKRFYRLRGSPYR